MASLSVPHYSGPDTVYINMEALNKSQDIQSNPSAKDCICQNKLIAFLWPLFTFISSYTILISMIIEIILLIKIYPHTSDFFIGSLLFLIIPTLSASYCTYKSRIGAAYNTNEFETSSTPWWYIPIINIPIYKTLVTLGKLDDTQPQRYSAMAMDFVLSVFMILPLYSINIAFILHNIKSYHEIPIINIIQLIFAFINMVINPIKYILAVNKPYSTVFRQIQVFCGASFALIPLITIELIHFIPLLFCYYFEHSITYQEFVNVLLIFNIPKILFIWRRIFVFSWRDMCKYYIIPICCPSADSEYDIGEGGSRLCCITLILLLSYIILPMLPYQVTILDNLKYEKNNQLKCFSSAYRITLLYLFISYGGSIAYIIAIHGWLPLSIHIKIAFGIIWMLILWNVIALQIAYNDVKRKHIAMF
eukprot:239259_1